MQVLPFLPAPASPAKGINMTTQVEALLAERESYVRRGLNNRVAEVDVQLAKFGIGVETASIEPTIETASRAKPRARKPVDE